MCGIYMGIFIVFALIVLFLQIIIFNMLSTNPNKRAGRWNRFLGLSAATIILDIAFGAAMSLNAIGWDMLGILIILTPFLGGHITLFAIGATKKEKFKPEIIKFNKQFVITGLITLLLGGIIIAVPIINRHVIVLNYLKDRFGEDDYEIVDIYDRSHLNDAIHEYYNGYGACVKAHKANKVYIVTVSTSGSISASSSQTINEYDEKNKEYEKDMSLYVEARKVEEEYENRIGTFLKETHNIDKVSLHTDYNKKMKTDETMTWDDLVKSGTVYAISIEKKNYIYNEKDGPNYVKRVATDLIVYLVNELKLPEDIEFTIYMNIYDSDPNRDTNINVYIKNGTVEIWDTSKFDNKKQIAGASLASFRNK